MPAFAESPFPAHRWRSPTPPDTGLAGDLSDLHPALVAALWHLGFDRADEARAFLRADPGPTDPDALTGMDRAVARVRTAVHGGEPIVVYGDFDADGVTATAVLLIALRALGARVSAFIPDREQHGYGLHRASLLRLADEGARLVITVDCGIRAPEAVEAASARDLDVIITDHHSPLGEPPNALAVIHPGLPGSQYPHKDLAGVGMAYKLAQGLLRHLGPAPGSRRSPLDEESLLDLVALGTVADVVPLLGENRHLVQRGLQVMRSAPRPGVRALAEAAEVDLAAVTSRDISFVLAPRLNAAGRMGSADRALAILMADDAAESRSLAAELEEVNERRRAATESALAAAEEHLAGRPAESFLFHASPDTALGVTGLVASRLVAKHYRPAAVVHLDGDTARGSARSIPEYDVLAALDSVSGLLARHGGHARAAGFTLPRANLAGLESALQAHAAAALASLDLRPTLDIAAEVAPRDLDGALMAALAQLEPHGEGNPRPVLLVRGARLVGMRQVGRRHLRFGVDGTPLGVVDAISFGMAGVADAMPSRADVAATLRLSSWNGQLELHVEDVAPAAAPASGIDPADVM